MAQLITRRLPWTSQPQYPVGINWSNPLARGIQTFWLPHTVAQGTATDSVSARGRGVATDGATNYKFVPCNYVYGDGLTVAMLANCNWRSSPTYERGTAVRTSTKSTGIQLLDVGSGKMLQIFCNAAVSTNGYANFLLPADAQSGVHLFSGSTAYSLASHRGYADGVALSVSSTGGAENNSLESGASGLDIARIQYGSVNYFGRYNGIYCVVLWNRVLSASEHAALAVNPWQIFAP